MSDVHFYTQRNQSKGTFRLLCTGEYVVHPDYEAHCEQVWRNKRHGFGVIFDQRGHNTHYVTTPWKVTCAKCLVSLIAIKEADVERLKAMLFTKIGDVNGK